MSIRSILFAFLFLFTSLTPVLADDSPTPRVHTVVAGDTLSAISQQYGVGVEELLAANGLDDPNLIYVGQQLTIPGADATPVVPVNLRASYNYDIRPGDTITRLAQRLQVSPQEILDLNGISRREARRFVRLESEILVPLYASSDLPDPFRSISFNQAIVQGQTGVVEVSTDVETAFTGGYGATTLSFYEMESTDQGYRYGALIPTGALAVPRDRILKILADNRLMRITVPIVAGEYETQYIVLPPSKGGLLEPQKVRSELEILQEIWGQSSGAQLWREQFRFPIAPGFQQTSPFGARRSYNNGPVSSYHAGSDWSAPGGTPIVAPADGVVVLAEDLEVRGGATVIDHGQGVYSNFWHQSEILVEPGQPVKRGETIGLVGTTGLSTGAHLHWEVRVNGIAVDPLQWTDVYLPYGAELARVQ